MNTHRQNVITFLALLAVSTASCDTLPVAPEMPTATTVPAATADAAHDPLVAVGDETPHRFDFDIALVNDGAHEIRSQVFAQADRWARIVQGSDLEDIEWEPGTISCGGLEYNFRKDVLDDLFVMVAVQDFDGGPGAGVRTMVCGYRDSSKLPLIGAIKLDPGELSLEEQDDLILHAFAHVLGFSGAWKRLDLLRNSSKENPGADTHFVGANAIAAFVASGGASYQGPKVPVENDRTYGSVNIHWRESVFGTELMTSVLQAGRDALSAITIQSLADIGYTVDVEAADSYTLPGASASASAAGRRHAIDLSGDVVNGPAVFYDRQGRVVRVVRN